MIRRIVVGLLLLGVVAAAVWLPREEAIEADADPILSERPEAEVAPAVELSAIRGAAVAPDAERWELAYPDLPPVAQRLTLVIGAPSAAGATARLTAAAGGDPTTLLERLTLVLDPGGRPGTPPLPPAAALDLRLDLLGERLSVGRGDEGATVIAGAFTTAPAGDWRAWRVTVGGGPQLFLGVSEQARAALLLPRALPDGPAILAAFRALLRPKST